MNELSLVNEDALERFYNLFFRNRLAHAYLFVGADGCGKMETALAVAKMVNCQGKISKNSPYCDICSSCLQANNKSHPDICLIDTAEDTIKIEQVKDFIRDFRLKSFMGKIKVCIIRSAEKLTLEASNSLLKTLEEPTDNTLIILTSVSNEKMLSTIVSRCHQMNFPLLSTRKLNATLTEMFKMKAEEAQYLSMVSEGSLGKAKDLKEKNYFEEKNYYIDEFILSFDYDKALKVILSDKIKTRELLNVLHSWVRDAMLLRSSVEDSRLVNIDRIAELKRFIGNASLAEINELYAQVIKTIGLYNENLNIKVPLMMIKELIDR